jgi:hypothetical protein
MVADSPWRVGRLMASTSHDGRLNARSGAGGELDKELTEDSRRGIPLVGAAIFELHGGIASLRIGRLNRARYEERRDQAEVQAGGPEQHGTVLRGRPSEVPALEAVETPSRVESLSVVRPLARPACCAADRAAVAAKVEDDEVASSAGGSGAIRSARRQGRVADQGRPRAGGSGARFDREKSVERLATV